MPPRKGIVKSGNAGNSSKATNSLVATTPEGEKTLFPPGFKYPLSLLHERWILHTFLTLCYACAIPAVTMYTAGKQKCSHVVFPVIARADVRVCYVDAKSPAGISPPSTRYVSVCSFFISASCSLSQRKHSDGWSFVVTLSKFNKRTSQNETVRLEPHPPRISPTALEARHWGATYALYRVRMGMLYVSMTESKRLNPTWIVLQYHTA